MSSRLSGRLWQLLVVVGLISLWEIVHRTGMFPASAVPPVGDIAGALWHQVLDPELWIALGHTLTGWAISLAVGLLVAVPLGMLIGSSSRFDRATRLVVEFLRPIPSVALLPLVLLMLGAGMSAKVFLTALACFWPLLVQTSYGAKAIQPTTHETARAYRIGGWKRLVRIVLPATLPYIATGFRLASAVALALSVTVELVLGAEGIGHRIMQAQSAGGYADMYALVIVAGTCGWLLNELILLGEKRLLHWYEPYRGSRAGKAHAGLEGGS